jgi:hypothetical protein
MNTSVDTLYAYVYTRFLSTATVSTQQASHGSVSNLEASAPGGQRGFNSSCALYKWQVSWFQYTYHSHLLLADHHKSPFNSKLPHAKMPRPRQARTLPFIEREGLENTIRQLDVLERGSEHDENASLDAELFTATLSGAAAPQATTNLVWSNMRRHKDPVTGKDRNECLCCGKMFAGGYFRAKYVTFLNSLCLSTNHHCFCSSHLMGTNCGVSACEHVPPETKLKLIQQQAKKAKSLNVLGKRKAITEARLGGGTKSMTALADACEALAEELEADDVDVQPAKRAKTEPPKPRSEDDLADCIEKDALDLQV